MKRLIYAVAILAACGGWAADPVATEWTNLFTGDLSDADFPKDVWTIGNGEITASKDEAIWTKKDYSDFVLDLEFKTADGSNSGVLLRCTNTKNWIPNSIEVQITDDFAKKWADSPKTWQCAAIFGHLAAKKSMVKKPGEWNHMVVTAQGKMVRVVLNEEEVTVMDTSLWTSNKKNPDGSAIPGWLSNPVAKLSLKGRIGLQGKHAGAPIWFRNVKIKELAE
jgi:hypothetical protein